MIMVLNINYDVMRFKLFLFIYSKPPRMADLLTRVPHVWDVYSSNPRPTKSYTILQTVRHCFNIYESGCVALALWRGDGHRKLVTRFGVMRQK